MPTDLTLRAVSAADPVRALARRTTEATDALPDAPAPAIPNPRLRLDGSLGMVVLEFRGMGGEVSSTIPSERAIAAYRNAALTDAPMPIGVQPPRESVAPAEPEA